MLDNPQRTADYGTLPGERDWSAAEEAKHLADLAEAQEWHFHRVRPLVMAVLAGKLPFCPGLHDGRIQPLDPDDLYEIITKDCEAGILARAFVGQTEHAQKLIDAYCQQTAAFLAKEERSNE
jgi:hypothetical protein